MTDFSAQSDAELMRVAPGAPPPAALAVAVMLVLEVEAPPGGERALLDFLALAFPFYEAQGGRMLLMRDPAAPRRFTEIGLYASEAEWECVDRLAREDPRTREVLRRWRALLAGPPAMRVLRTVSPGG